MANPLTIVLSGAAGAGLEYLFDPDRGSARRAQLRDQLLARARRGGSSAVGAGQHAVQQAYGAVREAAPGGGGETLSDAGLARKVEAHIFRAADAPKGQVDVNAEGQIVYLRGEVRDRQMIDRLVEEASQVDGVLRVENLLHLPGQPAPTKR